MWCSVQRFPVCSAVSLYFKPFCKTLKISCYWLETRSLLLFPNQCVNKTNGTDKWSDTLSLNCMCASHAEKNWQYQQHYRSALASGRLWLCQVMIWWFGEFKAIQYGCSIPSCHPTISVRGFSEEMKARLLMFAPFYLLNITLFVFINHDTISLEIKPSDVMKECIIKANLILLQKLHSAPASQWKWSLHQPETPYFSAGNGQPRILLWNTWRE